MPSNCELVSAVYWVSSPHKFVKPITVEIQHCASLSSDKQCSWLTFVHTKCTQKELPYIFKERVGGVFSPHSSYGSLSLSHFSGVGIIIRPPLQRYFRVQPGLSASTQAISSEFGQRQQQQQSSGQAFSSEQLQLKERQQQSSESAELAIDSWQQQQSSDSSRWALNSDLGQQLQQQPSTQSEAACQTGQGEEGGDVFEQYRAQLYIICKLVNERKVDFVVTKNLDSCSTVSKLCRPYSMHAFTCTGTSMQVVKKEYFSHGQSEFSFIFSFKEEFVSLKIPEKGELGGWKITPFYDPKVSCLLYGKVLISS